MHGSAHERAVCLCLVSTPGAFVDMEVDFSSFNLFIALMQIEEQLPDSVDETDVKKKPQYMNLS